MFKNKCAFYKVLMTKEEVRGRGCLIEGVLNIKKML